MREPCSPRPDMPVDHEALRVYLRGFINPAGATVPYDFEGAVQLLLALLDNIREHALEVEVEELPERLSPEQGQFVASLAARIAQARQGE